jgi:hypothetical protein
MGRIHFSADGSLLLAAKACVIAWHLLRAGLSVRDLRRTSTLRVCSMVISPTAGWVRQRYFGFRPIGFLGRRKSTGHLDGSGYPACCFPRASSPGWAAYSACPHGWVAVGLASWSRCSASPPEAFFCFCYCCPMVLLKRRSVLRAFAGRLGFDHSDVRVLFRITNLVSLRALEQRNGVARSSLISNFLTSIGRHSLVLEVRS